MRVSSWYALLVAMIVAVGCGDGEGEKQGDKTPAPKSELIGPDGGTVELEGLTVVIPPGALEEEVEISVGAVSDDPSGDFSRLSLVYEFGPDGLQFLIPVTVSIPYVGQPADPGIYWASTGEPFVRIGGTASGGAVAAEVSHFSKGFVGDIKTEDPGDPKDPDDPKDPEDPEEPEEPDLEITSLTNWNRSGLSSFEVRQMAVASDGDALLFGNYGGPLDVGDTTLEGTGKALVRLAPNGAGRWANVELPGLTNLIAPLPDGAVLYAEPKSIGSVNADGTLGWSLKVSGGNIQPFSAAVSESGNIAVVGVANGGPNLGGGVIPTTGGQPALFAILSASGQHVYSTGHAGEDGTASHELVTAAPGGGFFVAGSYIGSGPDLGGGPLQSTNQVFGAQFVYVAKFNEAGAHVWSMGVGSEGDQSHSLMPITMDASGDEVILAVRYHNGRLELPTGPIADERGGGLALLRFDAADGELLGHQSFHNAVTSHNPVVPNDGSLYIAGYTENATVNFGGGRIPAELDPNPSHNGYFAILGADGSHQLSHGWAGWIDMEVFKIHHIEGRTLMPDGAGGHWFLGEYQGEMSFLSDTPLPLGEDRQIFLVHFTEDD